MVKQQPQTKRVSSSLFRLSAISAALLSLVACGGGGGSTGTPTAAPPPVASPPPAPVAGLLTDAQLRTDNDPAGAIVSATTAEWFADNAQIVRSLTEDEDFSDLAFFAPLIEDKRLVLLGESSHGVEEYSQAKVRLIKYLHETQGFNVLAFEGGLFDCEFAQQLLVSSTARRAMSSCLFQVWQTRTLQELFEYARSTQATATPLRLTGFDVQASGIRFNERADQLRALFTKVSADRADQVFAIEREYAHLARAALGAGSDADAAMVDLAVALPDIRTDYGGIADELEASTAMITADGDFTTRDVQIAAQYARTSPDWAAQILEQFSAGRGYAERDGGMANNLIALSETIYPNDKIIAWAHNGHLRHLGTGLAPDANMGAIVHRRLEDIMYTVGFYMYRGQHTFPDNSLQTVDAPMPNSLEAIFHSRRLAWLFLDLEDAATTPGHEWINLQTPTWAWGEFALTLTLADEYDGLFMIDRVSPPETL